MGNGLVGGSESHLDVSVDSVVLSVLLKSVLNNRSYGSNHIRRSEEPIKAH